MTGPRGCAPPKKQCEKEWLRIYSPWSTASPALLVKNWASRPEKRKDSTATHLFSAIPRLFEEANIRFVRMIGTDDLLAMNIINELERRGVDVIGGPDEIPTDQVVLISEGDRFYGQAFPLTFATMMRFLTNDKKAKRQYEKGGNGPMARLWSTRQVEPNWIEYSEALASSSDDPDALPSNLHLYAYFKGIDGRRPDIERQEETSSDPTGESSKWGYNPNLELPIGQSQLDYARRMAQRLYEEFRGMGWHRRRLKAIGVVGTDVYDKLILLHALRERFGHAILFMTDLDARLLHHEQSKWTQNVVVVSNFGLELHPDYHGQTRANRTATPPPGTFRFCPFRDNYQTALFLACRTALGLREGNTKAEPRLRDLDPNDLTRLLVDSRIFEVGRRRTVDLSRFGEDDAGLHPPRHTAESTKKRPGSLFWLCMCAFAITLLSIPLVRGLQRLTPWRYRDADSDRRSGARKTCREVIRILVMIVFPLILFVGLIVHDHYWQWDGEPFSLSSGTSAWPGLAIWLLAVLVGVHFVIHAPRIVRQNNVRIAADFGLHRPGKIPSLASDVTSAKEAVRDWLTELVGGQPNDRAGTFGGETVDAQERWEKYIERGCSYRRILKTTASSILFFIVIVVLMELFGSPFVPSRGRLSHGMHVLLGIFVAGLLLFLLFFTIDAISLCLRLIGPLIAHETIWPREVPGVQLLDPASLWSDRKSWTDVRFIAQMTESVGKLLYMPSILLLLIMAGRFGYFDSWGFPFQVALVYAGIALCLSVCAVGLMLAARRAKATALRTLNKKLSSVQVDGRADQIKAMIEDIRSIKQGAFRPPSENPVIHFLLIPSGGVSLLALLAYVLPT